ncbi:MAG TPA: hypothetical protein VD993_06410 [Chitinophagaceae bacterium]|nr:hypothetical protein [Chitinophagaceae bacterium]
MKKIFYLIALTAFMAGCGGSAAVSNGDKVDLDKFSFTASYRDLPRNALDTSYHTYSVQIDYGYLTRLSLKRGELENQVRLEGWRRLPYGAHVQVKIKFEDLIIQSSDVREKEEVIKDKDGKETGKRKYYVVEVGYTFGAQAKITDYKGAFIDEIQLASRDQRRTHYSDNFSSAAEANVYSKIGLVMLQPQLTRQSMNGVLENLSNNLTVNYGYPERTVNDFFWIVNSRKHPEYENHRRAWLNFRQAIAMMSPDEPLDEVKKAMQPVIEYYNKVKKMYASDSKGDKKMRYASYYNLAKIYWYLDDPDAGMKEATELIINGYDAKDGNGLEAGASNLKMLMRQAKRDSRHFRIQIEAYQGPDMAAGQ